MVRSKEPSYPLHYAVHVCYSFCGFQCIKSNDVAVSHLVVAKACMATEGARNVHSAEEGPLFADGRGVVRLEQFVLDGGMVPFVDDVVQAVALRHHVDLRRKWKIIV